MERAHEEARLIEWVAESPEIDYLAEGREVSRATELMERENGRWFSPVIDEEQGHDPKETEDGEVLSSSHLCSSSSVQATARCGSSKVWGGVRGGRGRRRRGRGSLKS